MKYYPCGCHFETIEYEKLFSDEKYQKGECPVVWELLSRGLTKGIFQLESNLGHKWCKDLKPENIDHTSALIAILRPGVMNAKDEDGISMADHYVRRKNGLEPISYLHPSLEPILSNTYGVCIYQEQIIKIAIELCGMTEAEAETLRKGIGKKLPEVVAECKKIFLDGAQKTSILPADIAITLWDQIEKSNRYLFNRSHSYEYGGYNLYWSLYAKAHEPLLFFTSYLFHAQDKMNPHDEMRELVNEAKLFNINVVPPSLLILKEHVSIINESTIAMGLCDIKGIGDAVYKKIKSLCTKDIKTLSWLELFIHVLRDIPSSACKALIIVGALDYLGLPRLQMLYEYERLIQLNDKEIEWGIVELLMMPHNIAHNISPGQFIATVAPRKKTSKDRDNGIYGGTHTDKRHILLVGLANSIDNPPYVLQDTSDWIASGEEEYLGISLTCTKIDACDIYSANCTCKEFFNGRQGDMVLAVEINKIKEHITKNKQRMAFLEVSDGSAAINNVVVFPDVFSVAAGLLQTKNTVLLQGRRDKKQGGFLVNRVVQI